MLSYSQRWRIYIFGSSQLLESGYAGWAVAYPAASPVCCSSTCVCEREKLKTIQAKFNRCVVWSVPREAAIPSPGPSACGLLACCAGLLPFAVVVHAHTFFHDLSPGPQKSSNNNITQRLILINISLPLCPLYLRPLTSYIIKPEKVYCSYKHNYINFEFFIHTCNSNFESAATLSDLFSLNWSSVMLMLHLELLIILDYIWKKNLRHILWCNPRSATVWSILHQISI